MSTPRERDQTFQNALLCSPRFNESVKPEVNRQAADDWGRSAERNEIREPFTPSGHGALDAGFWPAENGSLIELDEKGRLPEDADLEYGVTVNRTSYNGLRRLDDGSFIAIVSGDVKYAKKEAAAG